MLNFEKAEKGYAILFFSKLHAFDKYGFIKPFQFFCFITILMEFFPQLGEV
jgi:hypothetical protein